MDNDSAGSLLPARKVILDAWGDVRPRACLICGSGWGEAAHGLSPVSSIAYEDLPGLGKPLVESHSGKLWLAKPNGCQVLIFQGRRHYYEGDGWKPVIFPVLLARDLGVKTLLLTNAAGGIRNDLEPGELMVLSDHLNFMGSNPLIGMDLRSSIPRFPDQSKVYHPDLRNRIMQAAKESGVLMKEGTYLALSGPAFETPAEIKAFAKLGADAVGMSTVPEAMVANALGMRVGAISCISNLAAGRTDNPLSHEEVEETSKRALPLMIRILDHILPALAG